MALALTGSGRWMMTIPPQALWHRLDCPVVSCRVVHETTPTALSLRETPLSSDNHGRCGFEVEQASRIKVWCDFGVLVELQSSTSLRPYRLVSHANLASVRPQPTNRMRVRLSCCVDVRGSNLRSRIQDAPGSGASNQEQAGFALAQAKPSRTTWMSHAPHLVPSHPKPYHPSLSIHGSKPTDQSPRIMDGPLVRCTVRQTLRCCRCRPQAAGERGQGRQR